jgi:hypothetical protein
MGSPQYPQRPPQGPPYPPYGSYPPPPRSFWQRQADAAIEREFLFPLRHWKIFLPLMLGVVAVLVVAGILVTRARDVLDDKAASAVPANAGTPASTVNGFLSALARDDQNGMYQYLCTTTKRSYSVAEFRQYHDGMKAVKSTQIGAEKPLRTASPSPGAAGAVPWGTIEATLIFVDDSTQKRVFQIVTEDGGTSYRICGDPY